MTAKLLVIDYNMSFQKTTKLQNKMYSGNLTLISRIGSIKKKKY